MRHELYLWRRILSTCEETFCVFLGYVQQVRCILCTCMEPHLHSLSARMKTFPAYLVCKNFLGSYKIYLTYLRVRMKSVFVY